MTSSTTRSKLYVLSLDNRSRMHGRVMDAMDSTMDLARAYATRDHVPIASHLMIELEQEPG